MSDDSAKFFIEENGIYYNENENKYWICSKLLITALTRNAQSENWGRLLEFYDVDGKLHRWAMPMQVLKGNADELCGELLRLGLAIESSGKARRLLIDYIASTPVEQRAICVNRIGWHQQVFVLPEQTYGDTTEKIIFQAELVNNNYKACGELAEWQKAISRLCIGNSRLIFAISAAFAAMLLHPAQIESGGIHLVGESSSGKTTALRVAASVYGPQHFLQRWRATTNGIESLAILYCDTLLILDELAQLDAKEASETAYLLANGTGKARANRSGGLRPRQQWRLLFLSAGEIGLAQHLQESGKKSKAGHAVRLIDVPAVTQHGIYENLHGYATGAELSKALLEATEKHYGIVAIHFLESITRMLKLDLLSNKIKALHKEFMRENLPANASGQVTRIAERFALISAAGELATSLGITQWPDGEAKKAAAKCFLACIEHRGGIDNQENQIILTQVKSFFEAHGSSRFQLIDCLDQKVFNRAGFKKIEAGKTWFYILPGAFKNEICQGLDYRLVIKQLIEKGWLQPDSEGKSTRPENLPGMSKTRCYVITPKLWES